MQTSTESPYAITSLSRHYDGNLVLIVDCCQLNFDRVVCNHLQACVDIEPLQGSGLLHIIATGVPVAMHIKALQA